MNRDPTTKRRYRLPLRWLATLVCAGGASASPQGRDAAPSPESFPALSAPAGNLPTVEKVQLGKALFWDEQLSGSGTVACGTCHAPEAGGADPRTRARPEDSKHPGPDGVFGTPDDRVGSRGTIRQLANGLYVPEPVFGLAPQVTRRMAPSVINAAFAPELFWDGRASGAFRDPVDQTLVLPAGAALESQAAGPPVSTIEMAHVGEDWSSIARRVERSSPLRLATRVPASLRAFVGTRSYPELFTTAFGTNEVTPRRIVMALASYQRTLVSDQSPWDTYLAGDASALTPQQVLGSQVFFGAGRCSVCHSGPLFTDGRYHDLGVRPDTEDLGRGAVTGRPEDNGRFRTPGLRNVALRGPYFHNGSERSLGDVLRFYRLGGRFPADPLLQPVNLSASRRTAVVAFLQSLTDPRVAAGLPPFDRPQLFTESAFVPSVFGAATRGAGGVAPGMIAIEALATGRTRYSLGLRDAAGGLPAALVLGFERLDPPWQFAGFGLHVGLHPGVVVAAVPQIAGPTGRGFATVSFDPPRSLAPRGLELFAQWVVLDPGAPAGLAATRGVRIPAF